VIVLAHMYSEMYIDLHNPTVLCDISYIVLQVGFSFIMSSNTFAKSLYASKGIVAYFDCFFLSFSSLCDEMWNLFHFRINYITYKTISCIHQKRYHHMIPHSKLRTHFEILIMFICLAFYIKHFDIKGMMNNMIFK